MPSPHSHPARCYGDASVQPDRAHQNFNDADVYTVATTSGSEDAYFVLDGVPTSGPLVWADGRHIFFEDEQEQAREDGWTPSAHTDAGRDALRPPQLESTQDSSIATPSARSSSTNTIMASTASPANRSDSDSSVGERLQRRTQPIDSSRVDQIQLFSDFLEMHFPSPAAKADLINRRSYLMGLPEIDLSSAPMLRSAVEAICYAHAGSNYQDQRLIQQSRRAYGKVLSSLVRRLNNPRKQNDPSIIVPSIMLLTLYDDTLPEAKFSGWRAHYWGVHEYLKATGPSAFAMSEPFSRLLFLNLRVPTLFLGIARRRAVVLSEPKWRTLGNVSGFGASPLGRLYPRALQLPGLLEKTDSFLRQNDHNEAKQIMTDLMALRGELLTWSMTESSFADKTIKHFTLVEASDEDLFKLDIEEHLVMSSNSTFHSLFDFSVYKVAQDYTLYWVFALILDCALLRVMHFRPDTEAHIKPRTRAETERDAANRARYLCRAAFYFSKFDSQGITSYLDAMLALAESFFGETSAASELGWCQSVRLANGLRLARLRSTQPRTLCRMGDMVGDLTGATKFKSRNVASEN